jgi:hypothetical protein
MPNKLFNGPPGLWYQVALGYRVMRSAVFRDLLPLFVLTTLCATKLAVVSLKSTLIYERTSPPNAAPIVKK